jgi:DNA repair protein RadD
MTLRFDTFLTRCTTDALADIFGKNLIELLSLFDESSGNLDRLRSLLLEVFSPEALLSNNQKRRLILELLKEKEVKELLSTLEVPYNETNYFDQLLSFNFTKPKLIKLFHFFGLNPSDAPEETIKIPATETITPNYSLFPHQRNAITKVLRTLERSPHRVVLHMPTGAGKTRTAMNIISQHLRVSEPGVVLWLANSEELCEQATDEFIGAWKNTGNRPVTVERLWGPHSSDSLTTDGIIIAGFQKIHSRLIDAPSKFATFSERITMVVVDEAHQVIAPTYKAVVDAVIARNAEIKLVGLTATPGRTWNDIDSDQKLGSFFARRKVTLEIPGYENPVDYLIEEGYLAKPKFEELKFDVFSLSDREKIHSDFEIPDSLLRKLADDQLRTLKILSKIQELATRHKRILIFATTVAHSDLLAVLLKFKELNAKSLSSKTPGAERQAIIDWYKEDTEDTRILCNFGILTTGFDAPKTSAAVIARPTKSLVLFSQMVGRATRGLKAKGNKESEIITVIDIDLPGFRNMSESFTNWEDIWE